MSAYGERDKKGGLARLLPGADRTDLLLWEDAAFQRLVKAERAPVLVFSKESALDYPDLWVTDPDLRAGRRLTNGGVQREGLLWSPGRMLVDYKCAKGEAAASVAPASRRLREGPSLPHHRLHLRADEPVPQPLLSARAVGIQRRRLHQQRLRGADAGHPVPHQRSGDVGGVVRAARARGGGRAPASSIPSSVGLHGHSWGGYQTAFLVTQTDKFSAAVAGAPLTDLVSMYSSIYWNTGSANQPIFESSQGRFTGDFLDQPDAYLRNSPVFQARKVTTPLMILHNDKDGAVDFNQGIEYFNTLRRLRKPVVMLQYEGENHGLAKAENQRDYSVRMREFFDHHLKGEAAPPWLADGVKRIDLEHHLEERALAIAPEPAKESDPSTVVAPAAGESPAPATEEAPPRPRPRSRRRRDDRRPRELAKGSWSAWGRPPRCSRRRSRRSRTPAEPVVSTPWGPSPTSSSEWRPRSRSCT